MNPALPGMPEPAFRLTWDNARARYGVSKPNIDSTDCYTAEQMAACFAAGRAEASKDAGWRDIETAPKTSRAILVWCPENMNTYAVSWYEFDWMYFGGSGYLRETPTLWKPMPSPLAATPTKEQP